LKKAALDVSEAVYVPSPLNARNYRCGELFTHAAGKPGILELQHFDKPFIFIN
jgi:hypothetical protein